MAFVLDRGIGVEAFDALHDDAPAWRPLIERLAARYAPGEPVTQATSGTVLVGLAGDRVVKLYPPFMQDHFGFERAALGVLHGALPVETPRLLVSGELEGWPYLVMARLEGRPLTELWPSYSEAERCDVLEAIGALIAAVHALPVEPLRAHAPRWPEFLARQRRGCRARQERTALPPHLLADLERFLAAGDELGDDVILTGEYTPMNLLCDGPRLVAMFDFGDGLVGPREYDWLGPMCFLAAGRRERQQALMAGVGGCVDRGKLLRLLLLHRYSNLRAQLALDGWQEARDLDELAERIWPP